MGLKSTNTNPNDQMTRRELRMRELLIIDTKSNKYRELYRLKKAFIDEEIGRVAENANYVSEIMERADK